MLLVLQSGVFMCSLSGRATADKQVDVPVVPKYWQTMWTPSKQRRLGAAIAFVSVVQAGDPFCWIRK